MFSIDNGWLFTVDNGKSHIAPQLNKKKKKKKKKNLDVSFLGISAAFLTWVQI